MCTWHRLCAVFGHVCQSHDQWRPDSSGRQCGFVNMRCYCPKGAASQAGVTWLSKELAISTTIAMIAMPQNFHHMFFSLQNWSPKLAEHFGFQTKRCLVDFSGKLRHRLARQYSRKNIAKQCLLWAQRKIRPNE